MPAPAPSTVVRVRVFHATSPISHHPDVSVIVPAPYKMISGGARANWQTAGALLTACFPESANTWRAKSKDHDVPEETTLDVFAIGLHDPNNLYEVVIAQATSDPAPHPTVTATVPEGYVICGGGANAHYTGNGSLLTSSLPVDNQTWFAASKDHKVSDQATITAYAVGLRRRNGSPVNIRIDEETSAPAPHPSISISVEPGFTMLGGGGQDLYTGAGNLLTAMFPSGQDDNPSTWTVSGKDHEISDPASVKAVLIMTKNQ